MLHRPTCPDDDSAFASDVLTGERRASDVLTGERRSRLFTLGIDRHARRGGIADEWDMGECQPSIFFSGEAGLANPAGIRLKSIFRPTTLRAMHAGAE